MAIGVVAGLVATKVTDWAKTAFYRLTPPNVGKVEERVRRSPPAEIAAENWANRIGVRMDEKTRGRSGNVVHYVLGAVWGLVYGNFGASVA